MGFGLYYDTNAPTHRHMCVRYRFATKTVDIAYAYFMFTFGMALCVVIVFCNLTVVTVLTKVGNTSKGRMGRTTICKNSRELFFNHTTQEEISFAKLMVVLCVFFLFCWVPLMLTIIIAQRDLQRKHKVFYRVADICMALNFILDPVIYVLSRRPHRQDLWSLLKSFCLYCFPQLRWVKSSDSRASQRNSSFPWNIDMPAANHLTCHDGIPDRPGNREKVEEKEFKSKFHSNEYNHRHPREDQTECELGVNLARSPVEHGFRNSSSGYDLMFHETFAVQIKIQDGHRLCVRMWSHEMKEWSEIRKGRRPCCKVNSYRDFASDEKSSCRPGVTETSSY
ncbi:uncharacterized protein LOC111087685 [Limulus polyphemus]|uniref:Uncharacterized protein LOC111087685 n=1 Tax=Limulus polyphemus TaxID=6850 RepID=A0ABM1T4S7_LIMPO|nr:uncharacterized protein LOC111087685 [Limulus polyphemus]